MKKEETFTKKDFVKLITKLNKINTRRNVNCIGDRILTMKVLKEAYYGIEKYTMERCLKILELGEMNCYRISDETGDAIYTVEDTTGGFTTTIATLTIDNIRESLFRHEISLKLIAKLFAAFEIGELDI